MEGFQQNMGDVLEMSSIQQGQRLWRLFNDKMLDLFVKQCEILIDKDIDLAELSRNCQLKDNLRVKYEEMKQVLGKTNAILMIANSNDEGWKVIQIDSKCSISIRVKGTEIELKSKGTLQVNIKHILYVAYLMKFYTQCLPFCKQSLQLKQPSKVQKIGFLRLSIPIPFIKDRSTLIRGIGINRLDIDHTICIFADGLLQNKQYLSRNQIQAEQFMKNRQILDLKHFAVEMKCLGQSQTQYSGYALVNHHLRFLPEKLIIFVAQQAAKYLFHNILKKLTNFSQTIWSKQLQNNYNQNKQFYDWLNLLVDKQIERVKSK